MSTIGFFLSVIAGIFVFLFIIFTFAGVFTLPVFLLFSLPIAGLIWFVFNINKFLKAEKSKRKSLKLILPLVVSAFPATFAIFLIVFIVGIFTGAISLM